MNSFLGVSYKPIIYKKSYNQYEIVQKKWAFGERPKPGFGGSKDGNPARSFFKRVPNHQE